MPNKPPLQTSTSGTRRLAHPSRRRPTPQVGDVGDQRKNPQ